MAKVRIIPAQVKQGNRNRQVEEADIKLKVAAYCRVSTLYEDQASSYETQVAHYKEFINKNPKWELAGIYADDGISGTDTKKRNQFNQMIDDAKQGKIDLIVTKSISRFARNTIDCLQYIRELKELHVAVFFEKENINTMDAKGEVLITIMASLAQQESESISRNIKIGLQYRYQRGQVIVNTARFLGYDKDNDGNLVINPEQAKVVKRIFYECLTGKSAIEIARELTKEGIKNGIGRTQWHSSGIIKILHNEKYIGDALLQKTYTVDFLTKKRIKNDGQVPQYYVENNHPAIISRATFYQVQKLLDMRREGFTTEGGHHHGYTNAYCFSSIVYCGRCKDIYTRCVWYRPRIGEVEKVYVWRCYSRLHWNHKGKRCMGRTITEADLEEASLKAMNELIQQHQLADKQIAANILKVTQGSAGPSLDELDQQLEDQQLLLLNMSTHNKNVEQLTEQVQALRKQREQLIQQEIDHDIKRSNLKNIQSFFQTYQGGLIKFDKKLVRLLIEKITIYKSKIEFTFKDGEVITVKM
jgi:DNA invertase Pin-like site-specific DNA recombinase